METNDNNPLISVITVAYNAKNDLEKTIQSVLNQTYSNIEFVIVDGGSTDGSVEIIKKYEERIDKWISEPDKGIYDAMNKGIKLATGEWLNFMNAGDVFYDEDVLLNIFSLNILPEKSFLYSDVYRYSKDHKSQILYENNRHKGDINHQGSIYKKKLHDTYGYYLVEKPYSVYDLLFFLSVPERYFQKVDFPIALVEPGGVSDQGEWLLERAQALLVLFGFQSITRAFFVFWRRRFKHKFMSLLKK